MQLLVHLSVSVVSVLLQTAALVTLGGQETVAKQVYLLVPALSTKMTLIMYTNAS